MKTRRLLELSARVGAHLREFEVDLGNKVEPWTPPVVSADEKKPRIEYPCLYIYGRKDKGIFDLPTTGKAMVNYRIKGKTIRSDDDGNDRYSADIEIRSIDPVKAKGGKDKMDLSAIVDRYLTELSDGRSRDASGRYADGDAPPGPADLAVAMAGAKRKRRVIGAGAAGAAVLAAGALPVTRQGAARLGGGALRAITRMR